MRSRPLAVFAGIWTSWTGRRGTKLNPVEGRHDLFGFLTTDANDVVGAIHPKAMPVILTAADQIESWFTAPAEDALKLQRPLPDGTLKIVMRGDKEDKTVDQWMGELQDAIGLRDPSDGDLEKPLQWKEQGELF